MTSHWQPSALAAIFVAATAGCFSPSIADCSIVCGPGGTCPDSTRCGADNRCHLGALDTCTFDIDAAPGAVDARPGAVDARPHPDAPAPTPDARDACPGSTVGEPDNQCPGERVGPLVVGNSLTISDHVLATTSDLDIFDLPVELVPFPSCQPGQTVTYALRITVASATDGVRLRRFSSDQLCTSNPQRIGREVCFPFSTLCPTADTLPHNFFFGVDQTGDNAICTPYTVTVLACGAGSTCDTCLAK